MFRSKRNTPPPFKDDKEAEKREKQQKQIARELYRDFPEARALQDELKYQDKLLNRLGKAERKYEEDGDINKLIKEYEYLFITADPPCGTSSNMNLVKCYMKTGQNDKAWAYLNRLLQRKEAELHKIRFEQAKILTKEKKYADAILMHLLGYLAISEWSPAPQQEALIKKVTPLIKKLKWDESVANDLASILETHVNNKDFDAASMVKAYRNYSNYLSKK